jgi:hypothetical protein
VGSTGWFPRRVPSEGHQGRTLGGFPGWSRRDGSSSGPKGDTKLWVLKG